MNLPESLRLLLPDGTVTRILLEDYLRGVLAAALPADAPLEAQKALAVAARTFAANTHRHTDRSADVCTLRHCQAWSERANPRASRAGMETRGVVAMFNDKLIEAFYFEHCDGKTRDAKGVLMDAPAYLKSVTCPCGFASLKGHGIGMCLRGMVALGRLGENYQFILKHYYTGIALQALAIDESTRGLVTAASRPTKRAAASTPTKSTSKAAPPRPVTPKPKRAAPPPSVAPTQTETPARKTIPPRRSTRPKVEHAEPMDERSTTTDQPPSRPIDQTPAPDPRLLVDAHSPEEDDLFLFLTVEDGQTTDDRPQTADDRLQTTADRRQTTAPSVFNSPLPFILPPASMPEEMPSASDLDFLAPPSNVPEDLLGAPPAEFLQPAAQVIEPNLGAFMPPVEKFYTPLDAPPTIPEDIPSFGALSADETPIAWTPPPPIQENAYAVNPPRVLVDALPGPRVIAGNLAQRGTIVTIRDARGNRILTVSGVAKQYGAGGFEAPLTDDGAYHVKFDGTELDVNLQNETVFIYYQ